MYLARTAGETTAVYPPRDGSEAVKCPPWWHLAAQGQLWAVKRKYRSLIPHLRSSAHPVRQRPEPRAKDVMQRPRIAQVNPKSNRLFKQI